ncbi:hypothetical protein BD408DRAFT_347525 [Parasitella parasitica]|nr:hypothetical protein BD408DRAFT_347525 [Parasitella parasitica]
MQPAITTCPATCELCGNWLPQHQPSCPRNGVHPSQWQLLSEIPTVSFLATYPPTTLSLSSHTLSLASISIHYHSQHREHCYTQEFSPFC